MDYYASWPNRTKVPKWMGVTLGGIFSVIVVVCVAMIVQLTRPHHRAAAPIVAAAAVVLPAPTATPIAPATPIPPAAAAPKTETASVAPASSVAAKQTHPASHVRKRAILAKHDAKPGRSAKSDLDRLLGL